MGTPHLWKFPFEEPSVSTQVLVVFFLARQYLSANILLHLWQNKSENDLRKHQSGPSSTWPPKKYPLVMTIVTNIAICY